MPGWDYKKIFYIVLPILLFAFCGFLIFYRLGNHRFLNWDEGIYAQVAKESFINGNQLDLTYFSQAWYEKPPLVTWLTEAGYFMFGLNEWGARFFVGLLTFLTVILTYFTALHLTASKKIAAVSIIFYFICYQFFYNSYFLQYDSIVGFFILLSFFAYLKSQTNSKYFYLFFSSLALGILTKNVIGLLPLPIIFFDLIIYKKYKELKFDRHFYFGLLAGLLVVLPWHIIETIRHKAAFWQNYLLYHVFNRFSQGLENNGGPWNYYFEIIKQNGPFQVLSLSSVAIGLWQSLKSRTFALLTFATIFIFVFFSSAQTKGYSYMVVIYPFLTILMALSVTKLLDLSPWPKLKTFTLFIFSGIFIALIIQQNNFKLFKWETEPFYNDNKPLADFINSNYPNTPIYSNSSDFTGPAFFFYLNRTIPNWPANKPLPKPEDLNKQTRVFHKSLRSVYNLNGTLYIYY